MGNLLPTPPQSNPTTTASANSNPPPESEPLLQSNVAESVYLNQQPSDPPPSQSPKEMHENPPAQEFRDDRDSKEDNEDREDEEEGECGFCLFMKGGGCRDTFTEWEKCVEEGEKKEEDIVEKCFQLTAALKNCMEAHSDYYAPLLQAEKAAQDEAARQLDEENQRQRLPDHSKASSDHH